MIAWDQFYYNGKTTDIADDNKLMVFLEKSWLINKDKPISKLFGFEYRLCMNKYGIAMARSKEYHDPTKNYFTHRHNLVQYIINQDSYILTELIKNVEMLPDDIPLIDNVRDHIISLLKEFVSKSDLDIMIKNKLATFLVSQVVYKPLMALTGVSSLFKTYIEAHAKINDMITNGGHIISGAYIATTASNRSTDRLSQKRFSTVPDSQMRAIAREIRNTNLKVALSEVETLKGVGSDDVPDQEVENSRKRQRTDVQSAGLMTSFRNMVLGTEQFTYFK